MTSDYLPLGCYGKLPCYGDFLRGRVFHPTSNALRDWIHESREAAGLEEGEAKTDKLKETISRRFLYALPGSVELLAGVIRPSTDIGGRRNFPFTAFVHFPRRQFGKHYALLPMALGPVWDALDDAWESLANVATKSAFDEVVDSTLIPSPVPLAEVRGSYQGLLQEGVSQMLDRDGGLLEVLLQNMPEVVGRVKKEAGEGGTRLELPISKAPQAACFDAAFWIDLLNHQFMWRRFEPALFLPDKPAEKNNRVLLLFGILTESDYPLITGCEGTPAVVTRPVEAPAGDAQCSEPAADGMTYADLLTKRFAAGA